MQIVWNGNNHAQGNGMDIGRKVNGIVQPFLCVAQTQVAIALYIFT